MDSILTASTRGDSVTTSGSTSISKSHLWVCRIEGCAMSVAEASDQVILDVTQMSSSNPFLQSLVGCQPPIESISCPSTFGAVEIADDHVQATSIASVPGAMP